MTKRRQGTFDKLCILAIMFFNCFTQLGRRARCTQPVELLGRVDPPGGLVRCRHDGADIGER